MKDIAIVLENIPGKMAELGETLGKVGINIEGMCATENEVIHILVNKHEEAIQALEKAGFQIRAEKTVLVVDIAKIVSKPGGGARLFRSLAQEGININLLYLAENNRLVIGVSDINKAKMVVS